jgi:cytochrome c oxidase subunit IV
MSSLSYEEGKKVVFKGLILLAVITLIEVFLALWGNGHIQEGFRLSRWILYPGMIFLSLYKAVFIINKFMHMEYEVKSLSLSVLMPFLLLVWAIIAFMSEGNYWNNSRAYIQSRNKIETPIIQANK